MRIDAHHHLWDLDVRDQPWTAELPALRRSFGIDELRPALVANEIDATVLVQTISVAAETPELLALADAEPVIAGVVGWIDLEARNAPARERNTATRPALRSNKAPGHASGARRANWTVPPRPSQ